MRSESASVPRLAHPMKRILVVDDEPKAISSFVQVLETLPEGWSVSFARTDAEALEQMKEKACHICMTVRRSGKIDGKALLKQVKEQHPHTLRYLLSDDALPNTESSAGLEVHGAVPRGSSRVVLGRALARECAVLDAIDSPGLERLLENIDALPSLPTLYLEFVAATRNPNTTIEGLGAVISRDMALTAKVLQIANSPIFGVAQKIVNPGQAATILGLDMLRSLVLSVKAFDTFQAAKLAPRTLETVWDHSLKVAHFTRAILECERFDRAMTDEGFLAGMMHDSGELVLALNRPDRFAAARTLSLRDRCERFRLETRLFGASHERVGAHLLARWGLPTAVVEAVAFHHEPSRLPLHEFSIAIAVHVADQFAQVDLRERAVEDVPGIDHDTLARIGREARLELWHQACRDTTASPSWKR